MARELLSERKNIYELKEIDIEQKMLERTEGKIEREQFGGAIAKMWDAQKQHSSVGYQNVKTSVIEAQIL